MVLEDAETILRPLIRSIDKRAEYTTKPAEGDRPGVAVTLSMRKRSATVTIPVEDLTAASQNSMRRNQLRTTLKRALDRMLFVSVPVASTKMVRPTAHADGFFRPSSFGRGRR
jgi:hypothetical protein